MLAFGLLLAGCANAGVDASPSTTAVPLPTAAPLPSASPLVSLPAPSVRASDFASNCLPLPHEAPDLEAALPKTIAGRPMSMESYHGRLMVICVKGGTAADVAEVANDLATEGLTLADVSVVVDGRADTQADPPYFIIAYRLAGHPGDDWPSTTGLDEPAAAAFRETDIEGKHVLVGEAAAVAQTEHVRGRPYVWDSPTVHYLIVTDDAAWAAEALRAIH